MAYLWVSKRHANNPVLFWGGLCCLRPAVLWCDQPHYTAAVGATLVTRFAAKQPPQLPTFLTTNPNLLARVCMCLHNYVYINARRGLHLYLPVDSKSCCGGVRCVCRGVCGLKKWGFLEALLHTRASTLYINLYQMHKSDDDPQQCLLTTDAVRRIMDVHNGMETRHIGIGGVLRWPR